MTSKPAEGDEGELKSHCRQLIRVQLDHFLSYQKLIIDRPARREEFHKMRLAGKPVRYILEILDEKFPEKFREALDEVRRVLEIMGNIHDCDVAVPMMRMYIKELGLYNENNGGGSERIPTGSIRSISREVMLRRETLFEELCIKLKEWKRKRVRDSILRLFNED